MNQYFINLFEYDAYANALILKALLSVNHKGKGAQIMAHTLSAQQVWLARCKQENNRFAAIWPEWPPADLLQIAEENANAWIEFIKALTPEQFNKVISYQNSKGETFSNQLQDIIAHVINHGTHHRAQAGQLLKNDGYGVLPVTDYILYVRDKEKLQFGG